MSLTTTQIIARLDYLGHLRRPFNSEKELAKPVTEMTLLDPAVQEAVRSYQALHLDRLQQLVGQHHGRQQVYVDGDVGPATLELLQLPTCGAPDYTGAAEMAIGQGNWRGCNGIGNYHCAVVSIRTAIPSFLAPHFDTVWARVVESYAEVGLLFVRDDKHARPQITVHFVRPDSNWIGLAIVSNNSSCASSPIWAKFDQNYQPNNIISEWTTLLKHEFGHNCGMDHSRGGVMNPMLLEGLPVSWKTDPSYSLLAARFGGEAVPRQPPGQRKMVFAWQETSGSLSYISDVPEYSGGGAWPTN